MKKYCTKYDRTPSISYILQKALENPDTEKVAEEMGGIAIPVVPIREDINLEIDEESNHQESINEMNDIEEPGILQPEENKVTVDDSGASVRPVIALRDNDDLNDILI